MTSSCKNTAVVAAIILVCGSAGGFALNAVREKPVAFKYRSRETRLAESLAKLMRERAEPGSLAPALVTADEVEKLSDSDEGVMIFDVRPDLFFEDGHIPGAKNLPRDALEAKYPALSGAITKSPCVVVYCAGTFCEEAEKMAEALRKLGHRNISVYRGGWEDWCAQRRKTEKS